jgi:hypothetical protein
MLRKFALGLSLLAAAVAAAADDAPAAPAAAAPAERAKPGARYQARRSASVEEKADPAAQTVPAAQTGGDVKMSGMSILGNEDSPKSLVIVPWKSSQLADMPSVSRLLDASAQPVDKDVFMRELAYYEFKSGSK